MLSENAKNLLNEPRRKGTRAWLTAQPWYKRYSIALALFTIYFLVHLLHLYFSWNHYRDDQTSQLLLADALRSLNADVDQRLLEPARFWSRSFANYFLDATFENWQSEVLQIIIQAAVFAYGYWLGSSQSKEGDKTTEAKIDALGTILVTLDSRLSALTNKIDELHNPNEISPLDEGYIDSAKDR